MNDNDTRLQRLQQAQAAVNNILLGKDRQVNLAFSCLLARGHLLIEDVPGVGKTTLAHAIARVIGSDYQRIQFTSDLLPADILGVSIYKREKDVFELHPGPIFSQVILADEVNRATPKTQSALLEAMQEHRVTVGRTTHRIEEPYFVLATQNPLEMEGTYPLPEAQLDRFFLKLHVEFPTREELHTIIDRTTTEHHVEVRPALQRDEIMQMQRLARMVPVARHVQDYAVRLLQATHPDLVGATSKVQRFVRTGASPRGAQAMLLAAKIRALFAGRFAASIDDIRAAAIPALRHRLLLNFEGEAEGVRTDDVIEEILAQLPEAAR